MGPRQESVRTPRGVSMVADQADGIGPGGCGACAPCRSASRPACTASGIGRFDDQLAQLQAVIRHGTAPACRAAPQSIRCGRAPSSGSLPSARTPNIQVRVAARQLHRRAECFLALADGRRNVGSSAQRRPADAGPSCQCAIDLGAVVEAEPAPMLSGARRSGSTAMTSRNTSLAQAQQVIVRAHVRMRAALGRIDAQHVAHPGCARGEVRRHYGDMVELGHGRA